VGLPRYLEDIRKSLLNNISFYEGDSLLFIKYIRESVNLLPYEIKKSYELGSNWDLFFKYKESLSKFSIKDKYEFHRRDNEGYCEHNITYNEAKIWIDADYILYSVEKKRKKEILSEIGLLKQKVYSQRGFPLKLRVLIFQRDKYTCKICGKHKDNLKKNIHLEIDHIIEWEDGGETTYFNGQTVCSECNKGKHHAKKHNRKIKNMYKELKKETQ